MAADARVKITLRCEECKQRNYNTVKNKKNKSDRLERSKYCPAASIAPSAASIPSMWKPSNF